MWSCNPSKLGILRCLRHQTKLEEQCENKISFYSAHVNRDGGFICTSSADKHAVVFDLATGTAVVKKEHEDWVRCAALTSDGKRLATGADDGVVRLCNLDSQEGEAPVKMEHNRWITSLAFSRDDRLLATSSMDKKVRIFPTDWEPEVINADLMAFNTRKQEGPDPTQVVKLEESVMSVRYNDDCTQMVTAAGAVRGIGAAQTWDSETLEQITTFDLQDTASHACFSPDGKSIAVSSYDRSARMFNLDSGQEIRRFTHSNFVASVDFTPDGRFLAAGCQNGAVHIYDVGNRKEIQCFQHPERINCAHFTPDGSELYTASGDSAVRFWGLLA